MTAAPGGVTPRFADGRPRESSVHHRRSVGLNPGGRCDQANGKEKAAAEIVEESRSAADDNNNIGEHEPPFHRPTWYRAYSFGLITAGLFVLSWIGQFVTQMVVEDNQASDHGKEFSWSEFLPQLFASTFENWQSEFLQLAWQAAGFALLYFWGSTQSKEGNERIERKVDLLLRKEGFDPTKL